MLRIKIAKRGRLRYNISRSRQKEEILVEGEKYADTQSNGK